MEGKGKYTGMWKNDAKIRLEYSDETLILRRNFFSKCSKNFSIGLMIMFKVCRRCLQRCSLRWKKNYERTIHTSKYIQKKLTPPNPTQGGGPQLQRNFNSIWRDLRREKKGQNQNVFTRSRRYQRYTEVSNVVQLSLGLKLLKVPEYWRSS